MVTSELHQCRHHLHGVNVACPSRGANGRAVAFRSFTCDGVSMVEWLPVRYRMFHRCRLVDKIDY
jgi:hypothetical protein